MKKAVATITVVLAVILLTGYYLLADSTESREIADVTRPARLTFKTSKLPSGITLHVKGFVDGEAIISAANWTPEKISQKVDWLVYHDWFFSECIIEYTPGSARSGHLAIELTFH